MDGVSLKLQMVINTEHEAKLFKLRTDNDLLKQNLDMLIEIVKSQQSLLRSQQESIEILTTKCDGLQESINELVEYIEIQTSQNTLNNK